MRYRIRRKRRYPAAEANSVQAKLEVDHQNDQYEKQANDVADRVMMMPDLTHRDQMQPLMPAAGISMKCVECEKQDSIQGQVADEEEKVQMKPEDEEEVRMKSEEDEEEIQMKSGVKKSRDGSTHV